MQCLRWSKLKAHEGQGRASVRHHKDAGCASEFAERLCACSIERFLCCRKWCHEVGEACLWVWLCRETY